ncbi:biotin--[acetyl-CoA-carboxylase] ligase [Granulicella tundricola]|uniref:Biotin/acetyl-CoA-carboxylase ligase n=1 Tax=Granulicella tundricola (strain ATCC BAA-1859 / DSM 23138 / MP5ACTX9) TaxID=1198114 RepID=E8X2R5_GRATM|nr:biotin--[acetyl-CoA-carboxylase] ligase [Granulicella tundricola]ADW70362.1 biotin/acetyl-CoA-carboxylase ligase [Granulicella tundricola MP5ACTX9]
MPLSPETKATILGPLTHLATTTSTNQLALEAAQQGTRSGVWLADEQTAGRGRGGHTWHSAPGDGLYVSILATPRIPLAQAIHIPLATGLAAQSAIQEITGLTADIRWPNDLLLGTKKCGGILVESTSESGPDPLLRYAVIGVGINLNHAAFPPDLAKLATSLRIESDRPVDRDQLLEAFLTHLHRELDTLTTSNLLTRFAQSSTWVTGKRVHVDESGGYTGLTCGLNPQGFLQVRTPEGDIRTVLSGGVRPA